MKIMKILIFDVFTIKKRGNGAFAFYFIFICFRKEKRKYEGKIRETRCPARVNE